MYPMYVTHCSLNHIQMEFTIDHSTYSLPLIAKLNGSHARLSSNVLQCKQQQNHTLYSSHSTKEKNRTALSLGKEVVTIYGQVTLFAIKFRTNTFIRLKKTFYCGKHFRPNRTLIGKLLDFLLNF